jgi:hypothetical protein
MKNPIKIRHFLTVLACLAGTLQWSQAAGTLPPGAVGYWPGDGDALDHAGTNNGTLENGPTYAQGRMGLGFAFTNNQDVSIAYSTNLVLTSCTVQAWIKPTGETNGMSNPWGLIFGQRSGPYLLQSVLGTNGGLVISLAEYFGSWYQVTMVGEIPTNQFTHFLATWDGTTARLYTNGVLNTEGPLPALGSHYTDPFFIGGFSATSGNGDGFFSGVIDEVALWNRVLTQDEITFLASWREPQAGLAKAVKPVFTALCPGLNYQLQVSADLNNWTNHGSVFTATNSIMDYPQYWDVDDWGKLFFRLQVSP